MGNEDNTLLSFFYKLVAYTIVRAPTACLDPPNKAVSPKAYYSNSNRKPQGVNLLHFSPDPFPLVLNGANQRTGAPPAHRPDAERWKVANTSLRSSLQPGLYMALLARFATLRPAKEILGQRNAEAEDLRAVHLITNTPPGCILQRHIPATSTAA
eukprot:scaffold13094_cov70-Phaeocystis_antarctica.AAC.12